MKFFAMWKMPILLAGLGAVVLLPPAAKAQSEIAPDHFDGTDSWEVSNRAQVVKINKTQHKAGAVQAHARKPSTAGVAQSSKATSPATTPARETVVVAENRKLVVARKEKRE